jgi:UDPglucose 6-dehydrogenase
MRVSVVGAGYAGLVTAACLADRGHEVVCADIDEKRVAQILAGESPIYEPGLAEILARNVGERLSATTDVGAAVLDTDLTLVAVGTPAGANGIDLTALVAATRAIGTALAEKREYHVVAVKSTVVPGTTDRVVLPVLEETAAKKAGRDFGVGVNPEFLTEGQAVADFTSPDRLVLGGIDARTHEALESLYAVFSADVPRVVTNTRTAEMIKYASNALLAAMISFANEIGNLCAAIGDIDVVDVMHGVHLSHYLTPEAADGTRVRAPISSYLEAGCGFGGSCLPKDVSALVSEGERVGQPMRVLRAVLETNAAQPDELVRKVEQAAGGLNDKRVTVLGLAFKPDTDDVRESPSLQVIDRLLANGARVTVHDPIVTELPAALRDSGVELTSELDRALAEAQAVVLVTSWNHYRAVPAIVRGLDPSPPFVDGRRMLEKDSIEQYSGIGI